MGGIQESSVHVYVDGPETTKPLGQVSSTDLPISYDIWNGDSVRTSCTSGLRHCVPAGREAVAMCLVELRILTGCRQVLCSPRGDFNVIYCIWSALMPPFDQNTRQLRIPGFPFSSTLWDSPAKELAPTTSNFHCIIGTSSSSLFLFAPAQVTTLWVIQRQDIVIDASLNSASWGPIITLWSPHASPVWIPFWRFYSTDMRGACKLLPSSSGKDVNVLQRENRISCKIPFLIHTGCKYHLPGTQPFASACTSGEADAPGYMQWANFQIPF